MKHQPLDQPDLESRLRTDPRLVDISRHLGPQKCWVVGGWIRDRALDREPPDVDLVVQGNQAAKELAARLGRAWGGTPRFLGKPGKAVWRLASPQNKVEIWPMENNDLESDIRRRDFSCNAIFWYLPNGPLIDLEDGLRDIADHRIRAISKTNLADDPVRLLRALRLLSTLDGFSIHPDTRSWIAELAPSLANAPRERVGSELLALAQAPRAAEGFREGFAMNLLGPAGPKTSLPAVPFEAPLEILDHITGAKAHPVPGAVSHNRTHAILAWLVSGWPANSRGALTAFAWSKNLVGSLVAANLLQLEARAVVTQSPANRREFIARCGPTFPTVIALAAAVGSAAGDQPQPWRRFWHQWVCSGQSILQTKPLLTASEVASLTGRQPGPQLGQILKKLQDVAIRREIRTPAGARRWLQIEMQKR